MEGLRIRANGVGMSWFEAENSRGTVINLPGLPARVHATPIVPVLLHLGWSVLQVQFAGTYDSDGALDPRNAHTSVHAAVDALEAGDLHDPWSGRQLLQSGSRPSMLVAHSFGTYVALQSLISGLEVEKAVFFSPMLRLGIHSRSDGLRLDLDRHVHRIATTFPHTHRILSEDDLLAFFTTEEWAPTAPTARPPRFALFSGAEDEGLDSDAAISASRRTLSELYGQELQLDGTVIAAASHGVDTMVAADGNAIAAALA